MADRNETVAFLDQLLPPLSGVEDSSNNGLQVEGKAEVKRMVFGVDACAALFKRALEIEADFIFVHHGLSWGDSFKRLTGITAERLHLLFRGQLSLYASHLPLDANPEVGHNFTIGRRLGLSDVQPAFLYHGAEIGSYGKLPRTMTVSELCRRISIELKTECRQYVFGADRIGTLGIVSGGGADAIPECARRRIDCLLTGEINHQHYHLMAECEQSAIAAGHYRTEMPGLEAVAESVAARFDIDTEIIDLPTGL